MTIQVHDTLIIGGGPGGLTAAIYLRRFRRETIVIDKGRSRLDLIPVTHNFPGFPDGIKGFQLLDNLRCQLGNYGGEVTEGEVTALRKEGDLFVAEYDGGQLRARTVLLATGIADAGLPIENWREAVAAGAVRLCPVCDGFDVLDKRIAIVSSDTNPVGHALFMRTFSSSVTLFERDEVRLDGEQRRKLEAANVRYVLAPLKGITMSEDMTPILHTADDEAHHFDVVYPMLGEAARSDLAQELGARTGNCMELEVDEHQRTTVPGLYAVGDVVKGLNQISVAAGQAAVAATAIHNALPRQFRASPR
ncbi:NAD(P)/FAD-dependent oxidoreductase [Massilia sp. PAMC28688]|uniref:NAD(P)/FAD-dependent oxidoreductase n=1 Tax=Massilia sp. PAMC28688 TaxID=2861283 RepID=UPI001C624A2A|nr:NAD(P)/FAD-dependent oxidoreductase [Massilia sp. PAMC28688]QYF92847.1 NAD(P)/FAD-dependent oxidoreductase [Massilia sp. PAMC28688]